jgi:hypothetical protein
MGVVNMPEEGKLRGEEPERGPKDASTQPAERDAVTGSAAGEVGAGAIEEEDPVAAPDRPVPKRSTGADLSSVRRSTGLWQDNLAQFTKASEVLRQLQRKVVWRDMPLQTTIEQVLRTSSSTSRLVEQMFKPTTTAVVLANVRGLDRVMPPTLRLIEQTKAARLSKAILGESALTSWRVAIQANSHLEELSKAFAATHRLTVPPSVLADLARIGTAQVRLTSWAVEQDPSRRLLGELSGRPLGLWRDLVAGLPVPPGTGQLRVSAFAGHGTLGLLGGDVLTSDIDEKLDDRASDEVEKEVLAPWRAQRLLVADELYAVLHRLDPKVPDLLDAAWDDIARRGPAAVEKIANCLVEVLDRTLRSAAPDDAVREWHVRTGRPTSEWEGRDRPPHALRVRFLANRLGGERTVVEAQAEALALLHRRVRDRLQAVKHASRGDVAAVRTLLVTGESLLVALLLVDEE